MIQRSEGGAPPQKSTHMFVVYVELQEPGPPVESIEEKLASGIMWTEGVGNVQAHYLATAELINAELVGKEVDAHKE